MARSEQLAVQGNGHLDVHHGPPLDRSAAPEAFKAAPPFFDITPEVFRRFMSYENRPRSEHHPRPSPYHDGSITSPGLAANHLLTATAMNASSSAPGTERRTIRGIPKKGPLVHVSSAPSLSATTAAWNHSQDKSANAVFSSAIASAPSQSALTLPHDSSVPSDSLNSLPLAQYFQQLRVSTHRQHQDPHMPVSPGPKQQQVESAAEQHAFDSDKPFRFSSLPATLTDDSFHYRQRAAQFILLLSQWASREYMSKWHPLFLPHASHLSKSRDTARRSTSAQGVNQHAVENASCSVFEDNESIHSHDHAHSASDNESEYLDFDACRTVHLGNKKKRKSSRHSSSGLHSISSTEQSLRSDAVKLPPDAASSARVFDSTPGDSICSQQDRALVDKTNTSHQSSSRLTVHPVYKREDVPLALPRPSVAHPLPHVRLPPRQTSGERFRQAMRNRIRVRLAPIFQHRKLEKMQRLDQFKQESQTWQRADDARAKAESDVQSVTTPEKRAPPKRTSKAGKRAQAIRGGGASAKPLTIAEIRARAAATSAGPSSGSTTPANSPSPSSPKEPKRTSHEGPVVENQANRHVFSAAAPASTPTLEPASSRSRLPAPTSTFDFRMSSHITLRLRELRSRLDGATRNLPDPLNQGGPLAVAKVLCDPGTPQDACSTAQDKPGNGVLTTVTNQRDGYPDYLPPWVRDALEHQNRVDEEQRVNAKPPQTRQSVASKEPLPPTVANTARSGALTPRQQGKQASRPARLNPAPASTSTSTTKAANGRRTAARQPVEPAHKHGAACKHGQPHGRSRPHGTGSALFTDDDWICVFCEYELYYGETPLMLRACRNRKKLVEKKSKVKSKAQAALKKRSDAKVHSGCQHDHDHHHHHDHGSDPDCMHDHDHMCHHDHSSVSGSECCHHEHDHEHEHHHQHDHDHDTHDHGRAFANRHHCECGNSIHSSDLDHEDK